jgi:hypothetical protein
MCYLAKQSRCFVRCPPGLYVLVLKEQVQVRPSRRPVASFEHQIRFSVRVSEWQVSRKFSKCFKQMIVAVLLFRVSASNAIEDCMATTHGHAGQTLDAIRGTDRMNPCVRADPAVQLWPREACDSKHKQKRKRKRKRMSTWPCEGQ